MEAVGFNPLLAFGWSVLCGFIMSMGAGGGGILAGVGHISVLGIADANMIKVVNQILEFSSRLVSVPLYYKQNVIGGPNAFLLVVNDFNSFADAMANKLAKEIDVAGLAAEKRVSSLRQRRFDPPSGDFRRASD